MRLPPLHRRFHRLQALQRRIHGLRQLVKCISDVLHLRCLHRRFIHRICLISPLCKLRFQFRNDLRAALGEFFLQGADGCLDFGIDGSALRTIIICLQSYSHTESNTPAHRKQ